jgi:hypothetical protein
MQSPPLSYPEKDTLLAVLDRAGLEAVRVEPLSRGTPFNNYLLVFQAGTGPPPSA